MRAGRVRRREHFQQARIQCELCRRHEVGGPSVRTWVLHERVTARAKELPNHRLGSCGSDLARGLCVWACSFPLVAVEGVGPEEEPLVNDVTHLKGGRVLGLPHVLCLLHERIRLVKAIQRIQCLGQLVVDPRLVLIRQAPVRDHACVRDASLA